MSDAQHVVVAGILQKPMRVTEVLDLDPEAFPDSEPRALFRFAVRYRQRRRGNALDLAVARTKLERAASPNASGLLGLVGEYESYEPVTDAEFRDAIYDLMADRKRLMLREHGAAIAEAVVEGEWREAEDRMREGLRAVEDASYDADRPLDLRTREAADHERARLDSEDEEEDSTPFDIGFPRITRAVSLRRKELTILGGHTGDGKTQFSKTIAYNAHVLSGARVLFVALEMTRQEMQVLFVAQHAASIDPRGVDYRAILDKNASEGDRKLYRRALDDFEVGEHEDVLGLETTRGGLYVWAPRKRPTMERFCDRVSGMQADQGLDVVVGDYLSLIKPSISRGQWRLDLKEMVDRSKELARDENVWVVMNHHVSRKGREEAERRTPPHYKTRDLEESSGVEKAADHFIWMYSDDDLNDDNEARVGIGKARKGRRITEGYHVMANFAHTLVAEIDFEEQ